MPGGVFGVGPLSKRHKKTKNKMEISSREREVDMYICNPLAPNKSVVQETLKVYSNMTTRNPESHREKITVGHPWGEEICCCTTNANEKDRKESNIWWQPYIRPVVKDSLIDSTDWQHREANIIENMNSFGNFNFNRMKDNCTFYKIPEGTPRIVCGIDETKAPMIFTLSYCRSSKLYFDMVVIPHLGNDDKKILDPLYYMRPYDCRVSYTHSGDVKREMKFDSKCTRKRKCTRMDSVLLHSLSYSGEEFERNRDDDTRYSSGCVVFHAFDGKTLHHIADTEPNICIVDKSPDKNHYNIYVYHLPIIEDVLGESKVAFVARFDIDRGGKKVTWQFSKSPTFDTETFCVGNTLGYNKGKRNFYGKLGMAMGSNDSKSSDSDNGAVNPISVVSDNASSEMKDIMGIIDDDDVSMMDIEKSGKSKSKRRRVRNVSIGDEGHEGDYETDEKNIGGDNNYEEHYEKKEDADILQTSATVMKMKKMKKDKGRPYLVIVQEPLLATEGNDGDGNEKERKSADVNELVRCLSEVIEKEMGRECKTYAFHHNIKKLNMENYKSNDDYADCKYSLPIAGGSIISQSALIKMCKPLDDENSSGRECLAKEFTDDIQACQGAIVIASNNYNVADFPNVYSKLNACYIIVNDVEDAVIRGENGQKEKKNKKFTKDEINRLLNNTNISMANVQQGPLSCILGYFPNNNGQCYFIRGFAGKRSHEIRFGTPLYSVKDVVELSSTTCFGEMKWPSRVFSLSQKYTVIDHHGRRVFDINTSGGVKGEDIYYQLETAAESWAKNTLDLSEKEQSTREMNNYLSCILAQMEVLLDTERLRELFDMAKENLKKSENQKPTRRNVLEMLREEKRKDSGLMISNTKLLQLSGNDDANKDYDREWFISEMQKDDNGIYTGNVNSKDYYDIIAKVVKYNNDCRYNVNIVSNTEKMVRRAFLTTLTGKSHECISTKSSYGKRGVDVEKIIKRDKIQTNIAAIKAANNTDGGWGTKNEKEYDMLYENGCKKYGYLLFEINIEALKEMIRVNASADETEGYRCVDNLLRVDPSGRFIRSEDCFMSGYLAASKNAKDGEATNGYVFRYEGGYMIGIPILDEVVDIMGDENGKMTRYPWSVPVEGGAIDFARILLRSSMHNLIKIHTPELQSRTPGLMSESSPMIGHLVMGLLSSAADALITFYEKSRTTSSSSIGYSNDSLFVNSSRGIFGLLISVMASGTKWGGLNSSYRCLLFDARRRLEEEEKEEKEKKDGALKVVAKPISFNFNNCKYWLNQFIKMEPCVLLKGVDIKENIKSNVVWKLKHQCQNMIDTSVHTKAIAKLKKEGVDDKGSLQVWKYCVVRPLVLDILANKRKLMGARKGRRDGEDNFSFGFADNEKYLTMTPPLQLCFTQTQTKLIVPADDDDDEEDGGEGKEKIQTIRSFIDGFVDIENNVSNKDDEDIEIDRIEHETMVQMERNNQQYPRHVRKTRIHFNENDKDMLMLQEEEKDDLIPTIIDFLKKYCVLVKKHNFEENSAVKKSYFNRCICRLAWLMMVDGSDESRNIFKELMEKNMIDDEYKHMLDKSDSKECIKNAWVRVKSTAYDICMKEIKNAWVRVKSTAYDICMKESGMFCIFIRELLFNDLNNVIIETTRHSASDIDECDRYLSGKSLSSSSNQEEGERKDGKKETFLLKAVRKLRCDRAKILKCFLLMRNPYYNTCFIPKVIKGLANCKSLKDFIHIYVGLGEINNHFSKLQGNVSIDTVDTKKRKWMKTNSKIEKELIKMEASEVEDIMNGKEITFLKFMNHKKEEMSLCDYVNNFNNFKWRQYKEYENRDKTKIVAIDNQEKLLHLEIVQNPQIQSINKWLSENCPHEDLIDWSRYSRYICCN